MTTWTDTAAVKAYLGLNPADVFDEAALDGAVAAANAYLDRLPARLTSTIDEPPAPLATATQAATMQAARWYSRRNSPQGVANFEELGAAYVSRYDPDLERLLRIGRSAMPSVG